MTTEQTQELERIDASFTHMEKSLFKHKATQLANIQAHKVAVAEMGLRAARDAAKANKPENKAQFMETAEVSGKQVVMLEKEFDTKLEELWEYVTTLKQNG